MLIKQIALYYILILILYMDISLFSNSLKKRRQSQECIMTLNGTH